MNLILTSIYGLSAERVEPFFKSLRMSGYADKIVVFTNQISPECRAMLGEYQAQIVDFESLGLQLAYASLSKRLASAPKAIYRAYFKHPHDVRCLIVNCWRFFGIRDFLSNLEVKPKFVLLADVRDVVFQGNPVEYVFQPGLSVASECVRGTIGQSQGNAKWLWEVAGWREMRRLAGRTPICSGTIAADHDTVMKYLCLMTEHMKRSYFWGLFDAIDQGLHNYFIHNQMIEPLHIFTNWNGPFLTLDSEVVLPKNKNRDGYLCNEDGSVIPIVHQYDRVKNLFQSGEPRPDCWKFLKNTAL